MVENVVTAISVIYLLLYVVTVVLNLVFCVVNDNNDEREQERFETRSRAFVLSIFAFLCLYLLTLL